MLALSYRLLTRRKPFYVYNHCRQYHRTPVLFSAASQAQISGELNNENTPLPSTIPHDVQRKPASLNFPHQPVPPYPSLISREQHIILPNPSAPNYTAMTKIIPTSLSEQFAMLNACIAAGEMNRASRIMQDLYRLKPDEMSIFANTEIHNIFMNGFIERTRRLVVRYGSSSSSNLNSSPVSQTTGNGTREAISWFDRLPQLNITPNADTYAILIKGFLRAGSFHTARAFMSEMKKSRPLPISIEEMLRSRYFLDEDLKLFRNLIKETQKDLKNGVGTHMDELKGMVNELKLALEEVGAGENIITGSELQMDQPSTSMNDEKNEEITILEGSVAEMPAVRAVPNVRGIQYLQETLSPLLNSKEYVSTIDRHEMQLRLEEHGYDIAHQRLREEQEAEPSEGGAHERVKLYRGVRSLRNLIGVWHNRLTALIIEEQERIAKVASTVKQGRRKKTEETDLDAEDSTAHKQRNISAAERRAYGPFLQALSAEKLSIVTILEILRLNGTSGVADGMKTARAFIDVGRAVESEINAQEIKRMVNKRDADLNLDIGKLYSSGKLFNMTVRKLAQQKQGLISPSGKLLGAEVDPAWQPIWPMNIRVKVGSALTSLLMEAAKISRPSHDPRTGEHIVEDIPAFFHTYQYVMGKRVGIIKLSPDLTHLMATQSTRDVLHPRLLPMLVLPRPWLSWNTGGYFRARQLCMRIKESPEQYAYLRKASEEDRLSAVLTGLDVLGSTRWVVNKRVFNVIVEGWNTGKAIADIPAAEEENEILDIPKPADFETNPKAKISWVREMRNRETRRRNSHSLRCDVNYKIETARAFLNEPMYFPHNMDFRGRAYPIPPTLNHLGNDLCRGILQFDVAKPLGKNGLRWLKIHLANLYGYDKHSFSEREQFTMTNLQNIMDSADNPFGGSRWWLEAECPWQCLSTCFELTDAIRSDKPEEFMSHLPVHQDGTCNGLQHYAALGGDKAGAQAVNLSPGDRPADVYTAVADVVNRLIEDDFASGNEYAILLYGKVGRKIIKQTVMTNVYGVTFVGARGQIENRLKEIKDFPHEKIYQSAAYLARKVFTSLGEMFEGARKIQDWLNDSAKKIATSMPAAIVETLENGNLDDAAVNFEGKTSKNLNFSARTPQSNQMTSVVWTTPLGLPIVQPYRKIAKKQITTIMQTVFIADPAAACPVNAHKQSTAFPPNFIHSLDATHMLMSAVACQRAGLVFAAVHDSYWTHACDIDTMNEVLRDQFCELHSQPIIENLRNEFIERYGDYKRPVILEGGVEVRKKRSPKSKVTSKDILDVNVPNVSENAISDTANVEDVFAPAESTDDSDFTEPTEEEEIPKRRNRYQYRWVPLEFEPLPPRGEFKIEEVRKSKYFFN